MSRLTPDERARLGSLPGGVDCARVVLHRERRGADGALRGLVLWASRGRAIALGNHVFLPDRCATDLATLAHELTHCGQYQRWGAWRYFTRGAAAQVRHLAHRWLGAGSNPYHYRIEAGKPFEAYGMEQQGQIVEDCFRGVAEARALSPFSPGQSQES
jgi:hypothetical protein